MRISLVSLVVALVGMNCGSTSPGTGEGVVPAYDATGKLARLSYDSDADGRTDMVAAMDGATVRTVEIDEDGDGLFDRREYYDRGETAVRVERVARQRQIVTRLESYIGGVLTTVEEDRDADGRFDRWETYTAGGLSTLELDTSGTGKPTRRLRYDGDQVRIDQIANRR